MLYVWGTYRFASSPLQLQLCMSAQPINGKVDIRHFLTAFFLEKHRTHDSTEPCPKRIAIYEHDHSRSSNLIVFFKLGIPGSRTNLPHSQSDADREKIFHLISNQPRPNWRLCMAVRGGSFR